MEYTDTLDDDFMPVFLINGFLEAGKTQFLQFTMQHLAVLVTICQFVQNPV